MDTKLTLNVDKDLVKKAKQYARNRGRSLSDLVEHYFRLLTNDAATTDKDISARVKSLMGSVKVPEGFDYRSELSKQLSKKYLK